MWPPWRIFDLLLCHSLAFGYHVRKPFTRVSVDDSLPRPKGGCFGFGGGSGALSPTGDLSLDKAPRGIAGPKAEVL